MNSITPRSFTASARRARKNTSLRTTMCATSNTSCATGAGIAEHLGVKTAPSIVAGTLGKGYGVSGGYLAGSAALIDFIRSFGPGFIFTTALPPAVAAAVQASVRHLKQSQTEICFSVALESAHSELIHEIHHTDTAGYEALLKQKVSLPAALQTKLQQVAKAA